MKKWLYLSILLIITLGVKSQESEDDETVIQLKKALAPHIKEKIAFSKTSHPTSKKQKGSDLVSLQHQDGKQSSIPFTCMYPFLHGVASGDPLTNKVIIWTRVTPLTPSMNTISVSYEVATDTSFNLIVRSGTFVTDSTRDFTVKVDVDSLNADSYYYYRFNALGYRSLTGRTKTSSNGNNSNVKLAFVNCNDYRTGYFNTFYKLAERNDLDAVIHLGDYIYEGGGGPTGRVHDPNSEIWKLSDYRTRISQYRLDSNLRRCHQLYPFINIWMTTT